jgi:protein ImuB
MRRMVSVWLPEWPITSFRRARAAATPAPPDDRPFALTLRAGQGVMLHAVNDAARRLGLHPGQTHADARAIAPALTVALAQPERDADALEALAGWFERFSPAVMVDAQPAGAEGLMLDMTGGAHLFGGEDALLAEIERRLDLAGIHARTALADTPGAAWALARHGAGRRLIAPHGRTREAIADLPAQALRLEPPTVQLLARLGLNRIGDLYALPRSGLARRFRGAAGLDLVRRLDQALGVESEPLRPQGALADYRTWQTFVEPLIDIGGLAYVLPALVAALAAQLERDGMGARVLALDAFRTDGRRLRLSAGLSAPSRNAAHLERLLKDRGLEHLDLGFGADALMLSALTAEPLAARQDALPTHGTEDKPLAASEALAGLIDRLPARLGAQAVRRPEPFESHLPERSERWRRAGPHAPGLEPAAADPGRPRPLLLFEPAEPVDTIAELPDAAPSRFTWRRVIHRVVRAEGPERLSPEWWRPLTSATPPRTRDYYAVEDDSGRRFWLYREGLYDRLEGKKEAEKEEEPLPTWHLQGIFP